MKKPTSKTHLYKASDSRTVSEAVGSNDNDKYIYLECECTSRDHVVFIGAYDWGNGESDFVIETQMPRIEGTIGRIRTALKYVFKPVSCNLGTWNSCILTNTQLTRLERVISDYRSEK